MYGCLDQLLLEEQIKITAIEDLEETEEQLFLAAISEQLSNTNLSSKELEEISSKELKVLKLSSFKLLILVQLLLLMRVELHVKLSVDDLETSGSIECP